MNMEKAWEDAERLKATSCWDDRWASSLMLSWELNRFLASLGIDSVKELREYGLGNISAKLNKAGMCSTVHMRAIRSALRQRGLLEYTKS